jgi:hypothetical protein
MQMNTQNTQSIGALHLEVWQKKPHPPFHTEKKDGAQKFD